VNQTMFVLSSLTQFWTHVKLHYSELANKTLKNLISFATSYLCEIGFSVLAVIKSKYRWKMNIEKEMRIAISRLEPRFEHIMEHKQAHPSHWILIYFYINLYLLSIKYFISFFRYNHYLFICKLIYTVVW